LAEGDGREEDDGVDIPQPAVKKIQSDRLLIATLQFNIDALKERFNPGL